MKEIKSIQIGENGRFFFRKNEVNLSKIVEIKEEWKYTGLGDLLVYRCYNENGEILHEISSQNALTINY